MARFAYLLASVGSVAIIAAADAQRRAAHPLGEAAPFDVVLTDGT